MSQGLISNCKIAVAEPGQLINAANRNDSEKLFNYYNT